ncbi:hypothetical protein GCM10027085_11360 [Spirosoma aerophilum]
MLFTVLDITPLQEAKAQLQEKNEQLQELVDQTLQATEQRYRSLVENLEIVVFQANAQGQWTFLNPAWERVTGFRLGETLGEHFLDAVVPEDRSALFPRIMPGSAPEKTPLRGVYRFIHQAGGYRWLDLNAQLNYDEQHHPMGVSGTLTDITNRKQAEEALAASERRFREIAENVDQIFWVRAVDEPRFLYMNPAFEKFTGKRVDALYENPFAFLDCVVEEDRPLLAAPFRSNESELGLRFRAYHQDGSIRWLSARIFGIYDEQGELTRRLGVATDITSVLEKEKILEASLQQERRLNELKSQFVSTASHEFRTPLTSISSSTELIRFYLAQADGSTLSPAIDKHLNNILTKVHALTDLITDTLSISKIEEGKVPLDLASVDVVRLVKELLHGTFRDRADQRQVKLQVLGEPTQARADRKLLSHVLSNLLSNAFKFSLTNPQLTIHFTGHAILLIVQDEGIGIPADELSFLFDKFYRASNAATYPGTGLGLAICRTYVELQQGELTVMSKLGIGTTFTIRLKIWNDPELASFSSASIV